MEPLQSPTVAGLSLEELVERCAHIMRFLPAVYHHERCQRIAALIIRTPEGAGFDPSSQDEVTRVLTDPTWTPFQHVQH